jgi:hypothetical protein
MENMSDVEGKKRQRSSAKRAVAITARKLIFSIHCDQWRPGYSEKLNDGIGKSLRGILYLE